MFNASGRFQVGRMRKRGWRGVGVVSGGRETLSWLLGVLGGGLEGDVLFCNNIGGYNESVRT